jgi:8-oxo-dGTP pyrophosphatase MutT (NUDIX family)
VAAGMINENETAKDAVIRETLEQTGYKINDPLLICKFFSSPGGASERIFLYFAKVSESERLARMAVSLMKISKWSGSV